MTADVPPLRIAALAKQIPAFEEMRLGPDGRLARDGVPLEMSAYCRRAVAQGVALARETGGTCTVLTLGPPSAEDVLREAVAFGADAGVLITDPAFAGSDTLATARAMAAALTAEGPFDLILVGRNSVDADTGQVGPGIAELLDLPFATGVKRLELVAGPAGAVVAEVGLEHDDTWVEAAVELPAVLSCAERLIDPCKIKDPAAWATVDQARLHRRNAADLGPGPWGQAGSPTRVVGTRTQAPDRAGRRLAGSLVDQVAEAVAELAERGALGHAALAPPQPPTVPVTGGDGPDVVVVAEPGRSRLTRELLTAAARLAAPLGGRVVVVGPDLGDPAERSAEGADELVELEAVGAGAPVEEDVAAALTGWCRERAPWAVLAPGTVWGREVASRTAAALGAGLTGDAVGLSLDGGRLRADKPAFGGVLVAAIEATSPIQLVTVRAGVLPPGSPRPAGPVRRATVPLPARGRVRLREVRKEDTFDDLLHADAVVGVGQGVPPDRYAELDPLLAALGAELAATRKVTDQGWLPRARQVGITGHALAPRLLVSLASSGKYNHSVGFRAAGTVLAVNVDPEAPVFDHADLGIVGDWAEVVPLLVAELEARST